MQYNDLTENVMFVRWTVHDFIIGLLWLCVCVCLHTLSQGTVYTCRDPHPSHPISLHHTFLYRFFFLSCLVSPPLFSFCLLSSCHFSFLILFCIHLLLLLLSFHFVSSCLISYLIVSYLIISFLLLSHFICSFLIFYHLFLCPHLFTSPLFSSHCFPYIGLITHNGPYGLNQLSVIRHLPQTQLIKCHCQGT